MSSKDDGSGPLVGIWKNEFHQEASKPSKALKEGETPPKECWKIDLVEEIHLRADGKCQWRNQSNEVQDDDNCCSATTSISTEKGGVLIPAEDFFKTADEGGGVGSEVGIEEFRKNLIGISREFDRNFTRILERAACISDS
jgi:hypothetical protein